MPRYAQTTTVAVEKSKTEIEDLVTRYGADEFGIARSAKKAMVVFTLKDGLCVRITLPLPDQDDRSFTHTPARDTERHPDDARRAWEQACRSQWRALALIIKAKLEAVEAGITTIEREFFADLLLPSGQTMQEHVGNDLRLAVKSGKIPKLLTVASG